MRRMYLIIILLGGHMQSASTHGTKRALVLSISLAVFGLGCVSTTYAVPGALDRTFDLDGKVTTPISPSGNAKDLAIQTDGKIITVGFTPGTMQTNGALSNGSDILMIRYNTNGSLDTSFGGSGIIITDFHGAFSDKAAAVAMQSDGKIVVAGRRVYLDPATGLETTDVLVVRYHRDGILDSGFGMGGQVITDQGNFDESYNVVIQSDGKIVVLSNNFIARYLDNGSLDASFGNGGIVSNGTAVNNPCCTFNSAYPDGFMPEFMALQADRIILGGKSSTSFAVVRLNLNGSLDTTFGLNGIAKALSSPNSNNRAPIVVQLDQKIIMVSAASSQQENAARFDANGRLDPTFGNAGTVTFAIPQYFALTGEIAIGNDGRILLGGTAVLPSKLKTLVNTTPSVQYDFAVVRLDNNGSLDTTFGNKGMVHTDFAESSAGYDSFELGLAIGIQSDGKIVLGGPVSNSIDGIGLARYLAQ